MSMTVDKTKSDIVKLFFHRLVGATDDIEFPREPLVLTELTPILRLPELNAFRDVVLRTVNLQLEIPAELLAQHNAESLYTAFVERPYLERYADELRQYGPRLVSFRPVVPGLNYDVSFTAFNRHLDAKLSYLPEGVFRYNMIMRVGSLD